MGQATSCIEQQCVKKSVQESNAAQVVISEAGDAVQAGTATVQQAKEAMQEELNTEAPLKDEQDNVTGGEPLKPEADNQQEQEERTEVPVAETKEQDNSAEPEQVLQVEESPKTEEAPAAEEDALTDEESKKVQSFLKANKLADIGTAKKKGFMSKASGSQALHVAVQKKDASIIPLLLKSKADVTAKDAKHLTPLELAKKLDKNGSHSAVIALLELVAPAEEVKVEEAKVEEAKVEEAKVEEAKVEEAKVEEPEAQEAAQGASAETAQEAAPSAE